MPHYAGRKGLLRNTKVPVPTSTSPDVEGAAEMVETSKIISTYVESAVKEYSIKRTTYEDFASRLEDLVRDLMDKAGIEIHVVESRAKSVESFRKKIQQPGKAYVNPFQNVSDLVGVRVILYYEEDVRKVCTLLKREFVIDKSRSEDKAKVLAEDQFGYRSIHYVVKLSKSR